MDDTNDTPKPTRLKLQTAADELASIPAEVSAEQAARLVEAGVRAEQEDAAARARAAAEREHAEKQAKRDRNAEIYRLATGVPFPKGKSANPGGVPGKNPKPGSLAARVREATNGNQDQVEFFTALALGEIEGATVADRIKANEWLANRGAGKAPDVVVNVEAEKDELEDVSSDEIRTLLGRK